MNSPVMYDQYQHVTKSLKREARHALAHKAWRWYDQAIEDELGYEEIALRLKVVTEYERYMQSDCTCLPMSDLLCKSCQHYEEYSYLCRENYGRTEPWNE